MQSLTFKSLAHNQHHYSFFIDQQPPVSKLMVLIHRLDTHEAKILDVDLSSSIIPVEHQISREKSIKWLLDNDYIPIEKQDKIVFGPKIAIKVLKPPAPVEANLPTPFETLYQLCKEEKWIALGKQKIVKSPLGYSLLHVAILDKNERLARLLIEKKISVNVNDVDSENNTALHHAGRLGCVDLIELLCNQGININAQNQLGQTPLHLAALAGQVQCVNHLLKQGASPNILASWKNSVVTLHGLPPIAFAILGNAQKTVEAFFAHLDDCPGVSLKMKWSTGTILHLAIHFDRHDLLKYLLEKQKNRVASFLEEQDENGLPPFILAAILERGQILMMLKEKGAVIAAVDEQGETAMHHAAREGNIDMIHYLHELGVSLTTMNRNVQAPAAVTKDPIVVNVIYNLQQKKTMRKLNPSAFPPLPPENLVFMGGGAKGIAYVGVVKALEANHQLSSVKRVAGTSAGAINAALLAFGYTGEETEKILSENDLKKILLDHPFTGENVKQFFESCFNGVKNTFDTLHSIVDPIGSIINVVSKLCHTKGLCKGENFRIFIENLIEKQTGIKHCTFKELRQMIEGGEKGTNKNAFKHLYVYATCLNPQEITCFSSEDSEWDDLIISDAVRASMSIPGVFEPHSLHFKNRQGVRYRQENDTRTFVDGGIAYNFPLESFDRRKYQSSTLLNQTAGAEHKFNRRTLGFSLFTPEDSKNSDSKVETMGDLLSAIASFYFSAELHMRNQMGGNDQRTIAISNEGVGTLDFGLSKEQQQKLIQSAQKKTECFFEKLVSKDTSTAGQAPISYCKEPHPNFVGRKVLLQEMQKALLQPASNSVPKFVIWGSGGLGKSETAIMFCNQNKDAFSNIFWIDAATEETYAQSYREAAKALGVPYEEKSIETIRKDVHKKLQPPKDKKKKTERKDEDKKKEEKPFLLVFDNAEQPYPWPKENGAILILSNNKAPWERNVIKPVEIMPFTIEEAEELIRHILECEPSESTKKLAQKLDLHPLAINQSAHYIKETTGVDIEQFVQRLEQNLIMNLQNVKADARYPRCLFSSWSIIKEKLKTSSKPALEFLQVCSHLHPDGIPLFFLEIWIEKRYPNESEGYQQILIGEILTPLENHGLIRYDKDKKDFSLHRLRQAVIQSSLQSLPNHSAILQEAWSLLASISKEFSHASFKPEVYHAWAPHILSMLQNKPQANEDLIVIGNRIALGIEMCEQQLLAKNHYLDVLLLIEAINIPSEKAFSLFGLGNVNYHLGLYEEAKTCYAHALEIRKKIFGPYHPDIALSLKGLGMVACSLNQLREQKHFFLKLLKLKKGF